MDANNINLASYMASLYISKSTSRITALHLDISRLLQGEPHCPPTQADLGTALELADLAMDLVRRQGQEQDLIDVCGRIQALCYDLLVEMYSSVEEFEHKAYAERKARAALRGSHRRMGGDGEENMTAARRRSYASSISSSCFLPLSESGDDGGDDDVVSSPVSSSPSSGRSVRFWDQDVQVTAAPTARELSLQLCGNNGKDDDSLSIKGKKAPTPVLRRQKGRHFGVWKGVC